MSQEQKFEFSISDSLKNEWQHSETIVAIYKEDLSLDSLVPFKFATSNDADLIGHYVGQLNISSPPTDSNNKALPPIEYYLITKNFELAQKMAAAFFAKVFQGNNNNPEKIDFESIKSLCFLLVEVNTQARSFAYYHLALIAHQQENYLEAKNYLYLAAQQLLESGTTLDRRSLEEACLQIADLHLADFKTIPAAVYLFKAACTVSYEGLNKFFNNFISFEKPTIKTIILQFLAAILHEDSFMLEKVAINYLRHAHDEKITESDFSMMQNFKNALLGSTEDSKQFFSFSNLLANLKEQSPEKKEFIFILFFECIKANIPHSSLIQDFIKTFKNDEKLTPLCQNILEDIIFFRNLDTGNHDFDSSLTKPMETYTSLSEFMDKPNFVLRILETLPENFTDYDKLLIEFLNTLVHQTTFENLQRALKIISTVQQKLSSPALTPYLPENSETLLKQLTAIEEVMRNPIFQFKTLYYSSLSKMKDFFNQIIKPMWAEFFSYKPQSPLGTILNQLKDDFQEFAILQNDALLKCTELPTKENDYCLELNGKITLGDYKDTLKIVTNRLQALKQSCEKVKTLDPVKNDWEKLGTIIAYTQQVLELIEKNLRNLLSQTVAISVTLTSAH